SRQCSQPFLVRNQAYPNSHGEIRNDWWRRTERQSVDWAVRSGDLHTIVVTVREPTNGHDAGGRKSKGLDHPGRSAAVRKSETGHRPHLQVKRASSGDCVSRTT